MGFTVSRWIVLLAFLCLHVQCGKCFNLTLLHTNDVHSHFIEFNDFGGRCAEKMKEAGKCFGGFARQVTKAKEIRASHDNVLYLNGGDFYQGTVWYTLHKWQIVADLVNMLTIDVMSLGNHEFDDGLKGLFPYLKTLKPKVTVCNIDATKVPEFAEYVTKSRIVEIGGEKFGIIGYLTPETKFLSSTGDLEFEDEVNCIKKEAKRLAEEEGLKKIIAVGHSGFVMDQTIAKEVPEIDIVVGGHTNTFLYTGTPPSVEEVQGTYPVVIEREDGTKALVVQDFAFGKFLGYLKVQFDDEGHVVHWEGNPILLNSSVPEDEDTLELLKPYGDEVKRRVRQSVGQTNVLLRGDRMVCRMKECNLGNFLADASLNYFIEQPTENGWNFVSIALWNSGGIRSSIDERINDGNITFEDVLSVAPFGNTMDVVQLKGKHLKLVLEHSVREYDLDAFDPPGSFLQVSGLRLTYNVSQPVGSRLIEAYARCANCRVPRYHLLEDEKPYWVVMNTYLVKGGDGFDMVPQNALGNRNTDELDIDIIIRYAKKYSPVTTGLEDRIKIVSSRDIKHVAQDHSAEATTKNITGNILQLSPSLNNIMDNLGSDIDVGAGIEDAVEKLETLPEQLAPGVQEVRTGIEDAGEKLKTLPEQFGPGVEDVRTGIEDAGEKLKTLPEQFGPGLEEVRTGIEDAGEKLKTIPELFSTGVQDPSGLEDAGEKIKTIPEQFGPGVEEVHSGIEDASETLKTLPEQFSAGTGTEDAGGKPKTLLEQFGSGVQGMRSGLEDVGDKLRTLPEQFGSHMEDVRTSMQDAGEKLKLIPEQIGSGIQGMRTGMEDVGEKLKKRLPIIGK